MSALLACVLPAQESVSMDGISCHILLISIQLTAVVWHSGTRAARPMENDIVWGQRGGLKKIMMSKAKKAATSRASATLTERTGCLFNIADTYKMTNELNKNELH